MRPSQRPPVRRRPGGCARSRTAWGTDERAPEPSSPGAVGGLVTAFGLILGGVVIGGLAAVVNDKTQLDRIQHYIDNARAKLPSTQQVRNQLPAK